MFSLGPILQQSMILGSLFAISGPSHRLDRVITVQRQKFSVSSVMSPLLSCHTLYFVDLFHTIFLLNHMPCHKLIAVAVDQNFHLS